VHALVTGAAGFLGRAIVQQLCAHGARVRGLVRRDDPTLKAWGVECVVGDIRDRQAVLAACQGIDTVFHTAAVAGIWGPWRHFYETNVLGTQYVLEACLKAGIRRLIFTSSPSVTFAGRDQCGVDESAPYPRRWLAHYPHTKALAEQLVLKANSPPTLLTCALRPHLIWGPGDPHLIPRLLERARRGRLWQVGDGKNRIDAVYRDNAAAAHLAAADALTPTSAACGRAYFISNGEPVLCWNWIGEILHKAGMPPVRRRIGLWPAYWMAAACEGVWKCLRRPGEPPMTRFLAAQLGTSHYFDIRAACRDLGYRPQISMEEGMRRLQPWLEAQARSGE
jgi:nucleoside-diphosphate-sugar epimerase